MLVEGEETTGLGSVAVGSEVEAPAESMMNCFDVVVTFENLNIDVGVGGRG